VVAAKVILDEPYHLVFCLASGDEAALACDLPGHDRCLAALWSGFFPLRWQKLEGALERMDGTYIQLCGRFVVELRGQRVEERLPGRQGRALFAYLVLERARVVSRDELIEAIWPDQPPAKATSSLTVLLSKIRSVLGPDALTGRRDVGLALPDAARVDVEQALLAAHAAQPPQRLENGGEPRAPPSAPSRSLGVGCSPTTTCHGWRTGAAGSRSHWSAQSRLTARRVSASAVASSRPPNGLADD
jgi:hypothetical protein